MFSVGFSTIFSLLTYSELLEKDVTGFKQIKLTSTYRFWYYILFILFDRYTIRNFTVGHSERTMKNMKVDKWKKKYYRTSLNIIMVCSSPPSLSILCTVVISRNSLRMKNRIQIHLIPVHYTECYQQRYRQYGNIWLASSSSKYSLATKCSHPRLNVKRQSDKGLHLH